MINHLTSKFATLALVCFVAIAADITANAAATVEIQNADSLGVGFNDSTPVSPVGGNGGTTLGQQRMNAFRFAADIWGATINSVPKIIIRARWTTLSCTADSAVLASAGTTTIHRNFPNAPFADTWYGAALANALAGSDRNGSTAEIDAMVNINIGSASCFSGTPWYLGFDNNHGDGPDLVSVLLHEFGHGLGFQSFTDVTTGAFDTGFPSVFDQFLRDNTSGKLWINMTDAERLASAKNDGNLVWTGSQLTAAVPTVLEGEPTLKINSPPVIARNYAIGTAEFGPQVSFPGVTASLVRPSVIDGCSAMTGVTGQIAFIDRGNCLFVDKVKNAQNAGALAVVIGNVPTSQDPTIPPGMGGTDPTIVIPSVSLNLSDANAIRAQLGGPINASVFQDPSVLAGADSSNRAKLYAPPQIDDGSSVSHFDTSMFPNQLMEPNINGDLTHSVNLPNDLTFSLLRDIGWNTASNPATIQLSATTFNANENGTSLNVGVTRTGDTSGVVSVDYATSDNSGSNLCNLITGQASSRCDYLTGVGELTFAAGETSKTIVIPIVDDVYAEGPETFQITLSNPTGASLGAPATATLTINDNEATNGVNPIDTPSFFVRQHYIDFLNREPDAGGFNFWTNEFTVCGADPQCLQVKRVNVSAAFFLSTEFQETGYLVYRMYKSGFGNLPGAPVPVTFNNFLRDTQELGKGVQVGAVNFEIVLENNKQAYALEFVQRPEFVAAFLNKSATQFVSQLNTNAGNVLSAAEQTNLVNILGATPADATKRAQVLRAVAEDQTLRDAEFNKAFVLMQYFGYLRRGPNEAPDTDFSGYNFWLTKLNSFGGNFVNAEMVKAFIISTEYRERFGP